MEACDQALPREASHEKTDFMKKPEELIGKKIGHLFKVGRSLVWYSGTVLAMNSRTKEYQVQYEGEEDICSFELLNDFSSGDLVVKSP